MSTSADQFWKKHPGLVWSNPDADDSIHIRAALLKPRFGLLLDVALEFGLARLRQEWAELQGDDSGAVERARVSVARILNHLEKGFALAARRN